MKKTLLSFLLFVPFVTIAAPKYVGNFDGNGSGLTNLAANQTQFQTNALNGKLQIISGATVTNFIIFGGGSTNFSETNYSQYIINPVNGSGLVGGKLGSGWLWASTLGAPIFGYSPTGVNFYSNVIFAVAPIGDGSGFTNLNASNLASGTVGTARLGSGSATASTVLLGNNTWGTVPAAALGANVTTNNGALTAGQMILGDGGRGVVPTNITGLVQLTTGVPSAATWANLNVISTLTTNNATLTSSRVQVGDGGRGVANATASGAVPIDADGSATTFAQLQALAPGTIVTNGQSVAWTDNALTVITNASNVYTWFASGLFTQTNYNAPFNWEVHGTNGVLTMGTGATTRITFDIVNGRGGFNAAVSGSAGDLVINNLVGGNNINAGAGGVIYALGRAGFSSTAVTEFNVVSSVSGALVNLNASNVIAKAFGYVTNGVVANLVAGDCYLTNGASAITFSAFATVPTTTYIKTPIVVSNTTAATAFAVTFPNGTRCSNSVVPAVFNVEGSQQALFEVHHIPGSPGSTNVVRVF